MDIQAAVIQTRNGNHRVRRAMALDRGLRLRLGLDFGGLLNNRLRFGGNEFCLSFGIH